MYDLRRLGKPRGCLELALRVDHLGPSLPFGLRLTGHGTLHLVRQIDVLHLHGGDLDAPGVGLLVQNLLELGIDLVTFCQELVQLHLAAHAPQGGLGELEDVAKRKFSTSTVALVGSMTRK